MELNLIEALLLISLDDKKGKFVTDTVHLHYGIAGAILLEFSLGDWLQFEEHSLKVMHSEPTGQAIFDEILQTIKDSSNNKIQYWINKLGNQSKKLKEHTLNRLIEKEILQKVEDRILWIFPNDTYPTKNAIPENRVKQRLHDVVFSKAEPTEWDIMLLSLIDVCELTNETFPEADAHREAKRRIQVLTKDVEISQVVGSTIQSIQTGVIAAITSSGLTSASVTPGTGN